MNTTKSNVRFTTEIYKSSGYDIALMQRLL